MVIGIRQELPTRIPLALHGHMLSHMEWNLIPNNNQFLDCWNLQ